jgi:hypothetical protein
VPADGSTTNGHTFSAKRESGDGRPASRDAQCTVGAAPKAAKHTDPSHWVERKADYQPLPLQTCVWRRTHYKWVRRRHDGAARKGARHAP